MSVILIKTNYPREEKVIGVINKSDVLSTLISLVDKGIGHFEGYDKTRDESFFYEECSVDKEHIEELLNGCSSIEDFNAYLEYIELIEVSVGTVNLDGARIDNI